ncbi:MAG: desulfoferrodoxin [Lachnospiraceae bacterium]|nr:desulfoferrodoxin [Lachnospiraceae bacterium]
MRVFKCDKCGKVMIEAVKKPCPTMCCGEAMRELVPGTSDGAAEKHVPALDFDPASRKLSVTVGSVLHPMLEEHFIGFIVLETEKRLVKVDLKPGDAPKAVFTVEEGEKDLKVYEYCNLHGLWMAELTV